MKKLELYYPTKPLYVTQKFGEIANLAYYKANGISFVGHNGIDMIAHHGQPIYAAHDGIAYYEIDGSQGHGVVIRSNDMYDWPQDDGSTKKMYAKSIYWHMCDSAKEPQYKSPIEPFVSLEGPGKEVKAGDLIGYADSTGLSMGDHLHFSIKPMLPGEQEGIWFNALQNNGYMGAVDPQPFFNGLFAQDIPTKHIFNINLKYSDSGQEVIELQRVLLDHGYFNHNVTGYYGSITADALRRFQKDNGITNIFEDKVSIRGLYFGPKTRAFINNSK